MFAKTRRIPVAELPIRRPQKKALTAHLAAYVKKNTTGHNRFAVVVGSKAEKFATKRNFLKRKIAGSVAMWDNFSADTAIRALSGAGRISLKELRNEIDIIRVEVEKFSRTNK